MEDVRAFGGQVVQEGELRAYNDEGGAVINLVVGVARELVAGLKTIMKRRVVLFDADAEAAAGLKSGDYVVFTPAERSPRIWVGKDGKERKTVEVRANGFQKFSKKKFDEIQEPLQKFLLSDKDFEFSSKDEEIERQRLESKDDAVTDDDLADVLG